MSRNNENFVTKGMGQIKIEAEWLACRVECMVTPSVGAVRLRGPSSSVCDLIGLSSSHIQRDGEVRR